MLRRRVKHGPIGVDIGATGARLVQLADVGGQPALLAAAQYDLSGALDDLDCRESELRRALDDAIRVRGFVGREVVAALGTGEFQIKNLRLPRMPDEELGSAVEFEAADRFDLAGRTAQIRHFPAGEVRHGNEIKQEVIVFAAPDDLVQRRLAMLESLRLRPLALDLAPCAVARSFIRFLRRADDARAVNVFIDVGWRGTSIVITHGIEIAFVKVMEIGGRHFTDAVAQALSLVPAQALELRLRRMREASGRRQADRNSVSPEVDAAVGDALRAILERMLRDIQLCLRYFAVTFRGQRPDCLTFVGGEAAEPSLIKFIGGEIDIPCLIGHPMRGIESINRIGGSPRRGAGPAPHATAAGHGPLWAVACGLALRGSPWVSCASQGVTNETAAAVAAAG